MVQIGLYIIFSVLPDNNVRCVAIDTDGIKWIGTYWGLAAYNENGFPTAINENKNPKNDIEFYPNPIHDNLLIKLDNSVSLVSVFDLNGQLVYSKNIDLNELKIITVFLGSLDKGLYILELSGKKKYYLKFE